MSADKENLIGSRDDALHSPPESASAAKDFLSIAKSVLLHAFIFGLFFFAYDSSTQATNKNSLPQHMEAVIIEKLSLIHISEPTRPY